MRKFITTFRDFVNESNDDRYNWKEDFETSTNNRNNFQDTHEEDWYTYAKEEIKKVFGPVNSYSGSADWGGIPVWSVKGDRFQGTFIIMDDDNHVILMTRKQEDEDNIDTDLARANEYDVEGLKSLLVRANEIKKGVRYDSTPPTI